MSWLWQTVLRWIIYIWIIYIWIIYIIYICVYIYIYIYIYIYNDTYPIRSVSLVFSSVQSVSSVWLQPHEMQHARPSCPSLTSGACSNSCPSSRWCHPTISSSVIPFSAYLQSCPASGSFLMSQLVTSGGRSIGASASVSVLPMNIQDWFPSGLTGLISLQSKGFSRVFSNTILQKH